MGASIIATRRARVESLGALAPAPWRRWVLDELAACPIEPAYGVGGAYDRHQDPVVRERLGQVFTPPNLARALARLVHAERGGVVLDPACGDGSLLVAVAAHQHANGMGATTILNHLRGWDIDPQAVWLCRLTLLEWGLQHAAGVPPRRLSVSERNLFDPGMRVDLVVCNPPYLEAKRMGRADPGLKERLKARYPQLIGAFDLYLAVAYRALELAPRVGLILPNKVCQARYARAFRAEIVEGGLLAGLVDLARLKPRPFPGSSVYPVLLNLEEASSTRTARVYRSEELESLRFQVVEAETWSAVGGETPWFVPFDTWPILEPLLSKIRLGEVARVVSTCSFHKKGLRETYVTPDAVLGAKPYLGGPSRARQTEIAPFQVRWTGWWIRYDQDELRAVGNALPPIENFERAKVIFNQHDRRCTAWADLDGRFVSKDVYPVAWPTSKAWSVEALTAVLNSTVFSALYNTVFQGILVGGETYHYLPAFLKTVPMPDRVALGEVDAQVRALQEEFSPEAWDALDRRVCRAYGIVEEERQALLDVHLRRVGAPVPIILPEG